MPTAEGQSIWTEVAGRRDDALFTESSLYLETPISPRRSVIASPWVASDYGGQTLRAEATLAVKQELVRTDTGAVAAQVGAIWRSDPPNDCGEGGVEARGLAGRSFGPEGRGFVNAELAGRAMEGGCTSVRLDLSIGYRPDNEWLGLAQVFSDEPLGGDYAVKAQLSLVRFGEEGRGIQIGIRARLDGDDPEPALVLGFWEPANRD